MSEKHPALVSIKDDSNKAAVVFIHGFSGHSSQTWGAFPELIAGENTLKDWDVFSLGYSTGLAPDLLRQIWSADPNLEILSTYLRTNSIVHPLDKYKSLAIVAHSMGGLIVQRAIVDDEEFRSRVGHLFLFGTPSMGLHKAFLGKFWKRQISDMIFGSDFIVDLRNRWDDEIGNTPSFVFWTVAGDRDEFVPSSSSLEPFDASCMGVISGDHLQIVKPEDSAHLGFQLVKKGLVGDAAPAGPWSAANVAVELREYHQAIERLESHIPELDDSSIVNLALAFEAVDRRDDAVDLLEKSSSVNTDVMGVLAGRFKRLWSLYGRKMDADRAWELYDLAYTKSNKEGNHSQAFYHGINLAFLSLLYHRNHDEAGSRARLVLEHCDNAGQDMWCFATRGEALLLLGELERSVENYLSAINLKPSPREMESMYLNASAIAAFFKNEQAEQEIDSLFRSGPDL